MTFPEYLAAFNARVADARARKAEQAADTEAAKDRAITDAADYMRDLARVVDGAGDAAEVSSGCPLSSRV